MIARSLLALLATAIAFAAAEDPELAAAKALDRELRELKSLPDDARARAIRDLVARIRLQPPRYAVGLATNLANDGAEAAAPATIQLIADTLAAAASAAPERFHGNAYLALARLARYNGARVKSKSPKFTGAMRKLAKEDARRQAARFTLRELDSKQWGLDELRGRVVLVNFWATWCPPCQRELPDLEAVWREFQAKGLVILAISDEDPALVRRYLATHPVTFPVLLDSSKKTQEEFVVPGIPMTLLYDRRGKLVAQAFDRPGPEGLRRMLRKAGVR